jgi:hypothetical protein
MRPFPASLDMIDEATARVLAAKSGAERLAIALGMYRAARRMLTCHLEREHPDWTVERIAAEVSQRLAHGSG